MAIVAIHSFLVHPAKLEQQRPPIGGTRVVQKKARKLWKMLEALYDDAEVECSIDISFDRASDGSQQNDCRDLIVRYARTHQMADARKLAVRLQAVTTRRSGLGLMFLLVGDRSNETKLLLSRFPADTGIVAEERGATLSVEFLERVFMKSATSYKAVLYKDQSFQTGFWTGVAIDRQIKFGGETISDYWIKDFLASDFRTTSAAGTRRLAVAVKAAISKASDLHAKADLVAAARLAKGLAGQTLSVTTFMDHFHLPQQARAAIQHETPVHLRNEQFRFDAAEFDKQLPLRTIELDTGGVLTAPTPDFDEIFKRQEISDGSDRVRFTAEGRIVNEHLRKRR